jgi:hypothetical protein
VESTRPPLIVRARLSWAASPERVRAFRSRNFFACNARFPDHEPVELFSIVLSWPNEDVNDADLQLLVPSKEMQPVQDRMRSGQELEILYGSELLAKAVIVGPS